MKKNENFKKISGILGFFAVTILATNCAQAGAISSAPTFAEIGLRILNFLLSIFATVGIIMSLVSGIMYFLATGNEKMMQKAKKSFTYGMIGTVVALSALIVMKFVAGAIS
jgi:hypothetical protein